MRSGFDYCRNSERFIGRQIGVMVAGNDVMFGRAVPWQLPSSMWRELVNLCGYHGGFINELWLFTCWAMLVRSGHYHEWVFFLINF